MNNAGKIAVVTGGNRGIGLQIGEQLAKQGFHVVLGCRALHDGQAAQAKLAAQALDVEAYALDVTKGDSVDAFVLWLTEKHGGLDVLVNNAGIAMDGFNGEVARKTLDVNFFGVLRMTSKLLPHLRPFGRVVMVTSGLGDTSDLPRRLRERLHADDLEQDELIALMRGFVSGVVAGTHTNEGWPSSAYRVSKMGLNAYTALIGRRLAQDGRAILCNAACPGWVKTRMGGAGATLSVEEGADTPVWLALLPPGGPQGKMFRSRTEVAW